MPCTASLTGNMVEVIQQDFWEKIRGHEGGSHDFRKKEDVRRGLVGKVERLTCVGVKREFGNDKNSGEG